MQECFAHRIPDSTDAFIPHPGCDLQKGISSWSPACRTDVIFSPFISVT